MAPRWLTTISTLLCLLVCTAETWSMPNFGRRENVPCAACHTQVPRLNRFGYEYRRAGFRMPENIGKEDKPFNFGELFAARVQTSVDYSHSDNNGQSADSFGFNFREFTMYPLSGSWGKYFSSLTELSLLPEDFFEVENAYVRANLGKPDHFGHLRFGIFHPFEGYGASDRPLGISRPLFQRTAANFNQSTFFTPWGFDQMGLEGGYTYKGFSASVTVFNGTFVKDDDGTLKGFPAQGGALFKTATAPSLNYKDFQLFLNQMIGERAGLSAFYYHGTLDLAKDLSMPLGAGNLWRNRFDRFSLYAYGQVWKHLALQAGGQLGIDHYFDAAEGSTNKTFLSGGAFGEVLVPIIPGLTAGARYDYCDPASNKDGNEIHAATAVINWTHSTGLQLIGEYSFVDTALGAGKSDRQNHSLQLRMIFIM